MSVVPPDSSGISGEDSVVVPPSSEGVFTGGSIERECGDNNRESW